MVPFGFRLERDPKNIIHHSCDIRYYPDQVLDFLLFGRHEYSVTGLFGFSFILKIRLTGSIHIFGELLFEELDP